MDQPNPDYDIKIGTELYKYNDEDQCWHSLSGELKFSSSQIERLFSHRIITRVPKPFETTIKLDYDYNGHCKSTTQHPELADLVRSIVGGHARDRNSVKSKSYELIVREIPPPVIERA